MSYAGPRNFLVASTLIFGTITLSAPQVSHAVVGELEEVVVTATRREESLQEIPIAVTVLGEALLQDIGATDFADFARFVPGLDFTDQGAGQQRITIRGVSPDQGEATVGMYVDEIPTNASAGAQFDIKLFDVNRIEVLRGPQGTLYGEGSMGGTIRVLTNKPNAQITEGRFAGSVSSVSHGGTGYNATAMINIPVVEDKFAIRAMAYSEDEPGYIDNVELDKKDVNFEKSLGGRMAATWFASDKLSLTGTVIYQEVESGGQQYESSDKGRLEQSAFVDEPRNDEFTIGNLMINYAMPWADFMSSTSYYERDTRRETASFSVATIDLFTSIAESIGLVQARIPQTYDQNYDAFVQEFRLVSNTEGPLQWVTGVYYKDYNDDVTSDLRAFDTYLSIVGAPALGIVFSDKNFQQQAVYANLTWNINERFKMDFGGRYFKEDQKNVNGDVDSTTRFRTTTQVRDESFSAFVPRISADYAINDSANLYGLIADGFRSGGVNGNPGPNIPATFEEDKVRSYEIGLKTRFAEGRVALDTALYYNDWTNMQTSDFDPTTALSFVGNLGEAHTAGVEVDLSVVAMEGLTLRLAGNYTEALLDSDVPTSGALKGDRLQAVPEVSFSASADYRWALTGNLDGMARADYSYIGSSFTSFANDDINATELPAYSLLNLRTGIETDKWMVHVYMDNVLDEAASLSYGPDAFASLGPAPSHKFYRNQPRTIGVDFAVRF